MAKPVCSLFVSSWESNPGFAIRTYETMFCRAGIALGGGDPTRVHFAFASLESGLPRNLPQGVNAFPHEFERTSASEARLLDYVRSHNIEFIQFLDFQVLDPLIAKLKKAGARTIISYWGAATSGPQPRWKYLLKRLQINFSRSRLDGLIFESQAMARLATHDRGIPAALVDVASVLGADSELFRRQRSDYVYQQLGFPRHQRIVVFAGHVIRRKGIHILVQAAVELLEQRKRKDVAFLICGNRDGDSEQFESIYAGKDLGSVIRFGGYRSDMAEIFCSSFCGVIPTVRWESFTQTSLEMAACGLPIVASRLQGLVEAVADGVTGVLFTPGDANELADVLERLLDEPERAAALGRNGRKRCEREFTHDRQFARYLAVLERRLAGSPE